MTYACDDGQMVRASAYFKAGETMTSDPLSSPARNSWLLRIFLAGVLVLVVCEASFGQSAKVQQTQPTGEIADGGFPAKPLHPAKVVIQLAVVGGLMMLWTFRPDPLRQMLQIGIAAECGYAMLQDQISVRMCPEYFTVAHPRIEGLTDPTLLGLAWGFLGAWWGGALIGAVAGFCSRLGHWPKLNPHQLLRPVACLLLFQAAVTAAAGWVATFEVAVPGFMIVESLTSHIPEERHNACFIVSRMHQGTYLSAIAGGVILCGWILRRRWLLESKVRIAGSTGDLLRNHAGQLAQHFAN
jgi:hypothetical protein